MEGISALADFPLVQRILQVLLYLKQEHGVVYTLLALGIGFAIGRFISFRVPGFQNRSEALLSRAVLTNFGPPDYHLMNHITLQLKDGTTQVDHILISRYGVFVIETKSYKGWIFANEKSAKWTQVLFSGRFKFQNPIRQNYRHVRAVQDLLDFLPTGAVKSVVVFTGEGKFKTEIPQGVFNLSGFLEFLREQTTEVMSLNRVQFCVGRLETERLAISGQTDVEHIRSLMRRMNTM